MNKFIMDNGAYLAKTGMATNETAKLTPNYVSKSKNGRETYIGGELYDCKDFSCIFYNLAFHKGMLINWDIQRQVWSHLFKRNNIEYSNTQLIVTEPIFNFTFTQECMEEVFFEEYGFDGLLRTNSTSLAAFKYLKETGKDFCLVVDSGYSFTHIAAYYKGRVILESIRRLNVGGKHLTNYLKEVISYRQLMVMDETYVINQVKEELCYVSTDFNSDLKIANRKGKENSIVRDYVLPDYANIRKGYAKSREESTGRPSNSEQIVSMNNERFTIPELLFNPSDIGIKEMGISEAIFDSIDSCFKEIQPHLYSNILIIGGNAMFKGFRDRIYNDLRSLVSDEYEVIVNQMKNVQTYAWEGGKKMSQDADFSNLVVTKKMYDEQGHNICKLKFNID